MLAKHPIALLLGLALATPGRAQDTPDDPASAAGAWLDLVAGGQAGLSWHRTDPYFQERIYESDWRAWVEAQRGKLPSSGSRRLLETATGRNEAVDPPVEWAIYLFGSDRPEGGRIMQRVAVARQDAGQWVVYDYGVWPDPAAIVANASIDPIPFGSIPLSGRRSGRLPRPRPRPDGRPAPPPRAVANPSTFPRRPPPR